MVTGYMNSNNLINFIKMKWMFIIAGYLLLVESLFIIMIYILEFEGLILNIFLTIIHMPASFLIEGSLENIFERSNWIIGSSIYLWVYNLVSLMINVLIIYLGIKIIISINAKKHHEG